MTPILFYGVPEGCSFGSIVALEWTGAPYRLCRVEMPAVVSSEAYKPVNPIGETPSLMLPDGRVMSESMAILNHIAARTVAKGWGFDPKSEKFDRLNQMLAFLNTAFFNAFGPLWHTVEHELEPQAKEALRAYGIAKVEKAHAQLETLLDGRDWLLGDEKSLQTPISPASPAGTISTRSSTAGSFRRSMRSTSACSRTRQYGSPGLSSIRKRRRPAASSSAM